MKITNVEAFPVPPRRVFCKIETDAGITGWGEASLEGHASTQVAAVHQQRPILLGENPLRIEHLWQRMWRGGFYPADRLIGSVVSGIDIALWDIKGQALGVPVYEILGGRCRDHVACFSQPGYLTSAVEHPPRQAGPVCIGRRGFDSPG